MVIPSGADTHQRMPCPGKETARRRWAPSSPRTRLLRYPVIHRHQLGGVWAESESGLSQSQGRVPSHPSTNAAVCLCSTREIVARCSHLSAGQGSAVAGMTQSLLMMIEAEDSKRVKTAEAHPSNEKNAVKTVLKLLLKLRNMHEQKPAENKHSM